MIRALHKAGKYFEEWSRPRMQNYINTMIADEYLLSKDLAKSHLYYIRSLTMYEKEGWTFLADRIKGKLSLVEKPIELQ